MAPLIVLLVTFIISIFALRLAKGKFEFAFSGRISMSVMLTFTSIAHFIYTEGMAMMLPEFIPFKTEVIYLTGLIEIAAAIGLLIPRLRTITAWLLILFFVLILPANIYSALEQVNYQNASYDGNSLSYLWFRVPLQILYIVWTYVSAIRK